MPFMFINALVTSSWQINSRFDNDNNAFENFTHLQVTCLSSRAEHSLVTESIDYPRPTSCKMQGTDWAGKLYDLGSCGLGNVPR